MRTYLDSSVILRVVLGERERLPGWSRLRSVSTSEITRIECMRALDRLRLEGGLPDRELARRRATTLRLLEGMGRVPLNRAVLDPAADPFPARLRSLDAIHLATGLVVAARDGAIRFATHDDELATAAEAVGLEVIGV